MIRRFRAALARLAAGYRPVHDTASSVVDPTSREDDRQDAPGRRWVRPRRRHPAREPVREDPNGWERTEWWDDHVAGYEHGDYS